MIGFKPELCQCNFAKNGQSKDLLWASRGVAATAKSDNCFLPDERQDAGLNPATGDNGGSSLGTLRASPCTSSDGIIFWGLVYSLLRWLKWLLWSTISLLEPACGGLPNGRSRRLPVPWLRLFLRSCAGFSDWLEANQMPLVLWCRFGKATWWATLQLTSEPNPAKAIGTCPPCAKPSCSAWPTMLRTNWYLMNCP